MKTSLFKFNFFLLLIIFLCRDIIYAQEASVAFNHIFSVTQNLQSPVRIAIDGHDIIYVTDANQKYITKYNNSGEFMGTIRPGGAPISLAINNENQIFIGDGETGAIHKLDENGTTTEFYTETVFPSSMVFSPDNLLYVVDSKRKQVIALDLYGNLVRTIGNGTLILPTGIACDQLNDRIYVSEHGGIGTGFKPTVKIWIFDLEGNLLGSYGSHGNGDGQFYRIQGLAVGRCGDLYATDPFQGTVSIFNNSGFISRFGDYGEQPGYLNAPLDIAIDSRQQIWVTSMNNGALEIYSINVTGPTSYISSEKPSICSGESTDIKIEFTGTAPWSFTYTVDGLNSETVNNTTDNPYIITVTETGVYEVTALSDVNSEATCFSGSVNISINALPTVSLGEDIAICETLTLDAGASFTNYLWNDGSTNQTLDVNTSGNYSVTVSDSNGCENSDEISITINPLPTINLGEDIKICEGEIYTLDAGDSFTSYLWNDGSTNQILDVNTSGNYSVTVGNNNGCENSDEISVSVSPLPIPDFTYVENQLEVSFTNSSTNADLYFWNFGDNETSEEINPIHVYKTSGEYDVVLTSSNENCGENTFSTTINILVTMVESIEPENYATIYPNPSNGTFTIKINNPIQSDLTIEITSITGKKIYSKVIKTQKAINQINLSSFPQGIYIVKFSSKDLVKTDKIIINE